MPQHRPSFVHVLLTEGTIHVRHHPWSALTTPGNLCVPKLVKRCFTLYANWSRKVKSSPQEHASRTYSHATRGPLHPAYVATTCGCGFISGPGDCCSPPLIGYKCNLRGKKTKNYPLRQPSAVTMGTTLRNSSSRPPKTSAERGFAKRAHGSGSGTSSG